MRICRAMISMSAVIGKIFSKAGKLSMKPMESLIGADRAKILESVLQLVMWGTISMSSRLRPHLNLSAHIPNSAHLLICIIKMISERLRRL